MHRTRDGNQGKKREKDNICSCSYNSISPNAILIKPDITQQFPFFTLPLMSVRFCWPWIVRRRRFMRKRGTPPAVIPPPLWPWDHDDKGRLQNRCNSCPAANPILIMEPWFCCRKSVYFLRAQMNKLDHWNSPPCSSLDPDIYLEPRWAKTEQTPWSQPRRHGHKETVFAWPREVSISTMSQSALCRITESLCNNTRETQQTTWLSSLPRDVPTTPSWKASLRYYWKLHTYLCIHMYTQGTWIWTYDAHLCTCTNIPTFMHAYAHTPYTRMNKCMQTCMHIWKETHSWTNTFMYTHVLLHDCAHVCKHLVHKHACTHMDMDVHTCIFHAFWLAQHSNPSWVLPIPLALDPDVGRKQSWASITEYLEPTSGQ